ncbi:hypothetical protein BAG01nite_27500 [Brevibacillus agri]|uniref:Spore germination protein n=1 Tax=Brevibacillus agri TaxID=51101 RepID=A0ABQ0SS50_9BACL|nr:hypothetical protein BAG01nite_27500 [Brevibacillus agri]
MVDSNYIQDKIVEKLAVPDCPFPFRSLETAQEAIEAVLYGNVAIYSRADQKWYRASGTGMEQRSVQELENESTLRGPRDAFVESLSTNLSLVRRRYPELKVDIRQIGRRTKTKVALLYINGIVNPVILDEVKTRLSTMEIDGVLDSGTVEQWIEDSWYTPFPQTQYS